MNEPERETDDLGDRLRAARPRMDEETEARVRETVLGRLPARPRSARRTSAAVAVLMALGLTFAGGGAAMAISGLASDTTAVSAQYGTPPSTPTPPAGSPGTPAPGTTTDGAVGGAGDTDTAPTSPTTSTTEAEPSLQGASDAGGTPEVADAPNQVVATQTGDSLPFTGFAAIPIVVLGALLIAAGALLRRGTSRAQP